jgi:hypothetical protein
MLKILLILVQKFIQSRRVILLHVQIPFFCNQAHPLSKLGLSILLFLAGLPDSLAVRVKIINLI